MIKMPMRYKLETTLNQEEENEVKEFCKKKKVSRYTLVRRAVFDMIKRPENKSLKEFS